MKIFLDIGHPAHVHYFKNFIMEIKNEGHKVLITARNKDVTHNLLDHYSIQYVSRGEGKRGLIGKFFYLFKANYQLYKIAKIFKPNLFLSFASPYAAQVAFFLKKPHITFTDTENAKIGIMSFLPFSQIVLTPNAYKNHLGNKHIRFNGFMEQCYLHPKYFQPNNNFFTNLNLALNQKYVIIRLVSWNASHDIGQKGFELNFLIKLVKEIENYAPVFISSEGDIPVQLGKNKLNATANEIHSILFHATLFIGEGATMASECAILGTPAIYINTLTAGTLEEQEKNGLVYIFNSTEGVKEKAISIIKNKKIKTNQIQKRDKFIKKTIDVTKFMKWFILNYPESKKEMFENSEKQLLIE
ncbi:MAG: hypothetical protein CMG60_02340 [Candidatus Marinimicrobia bacterium]|nr:hypothetical protein [Candidatus Neomarinimicrobiota bacterium]